MKKSLKSAIKWLYGHITLQQLFLIIQIIVVIGWLVCFICQQTAGTHELAGHYHNACVTHVIISWVCTFAVIIAGMFEFGVTPFFPKFIAHNAED